MIRTLAHTCEPFLHLRAGLGLNFVFVFVQSKVFLLARYSDSVRAEGYWYGTFVIAICR